METGLAGRTVVVTGGTANIGRGVVLAFAAEAANVVVVGRDEEAGHRVCQQALERGAKDVLWHAADVTDQGAVAAMADAVIGRFHAVDVLVNNVGGNVDVGPFAESDPGTWEQDIALNILSTLHCTRAILPGMIERTSGRIVNIGSTAGIIGDPMMAVYSAMKGAVHTFTRVLALEVGKHGITVNAIAPYGTAPEDPSDVSRGSRWHPEGLFAQLATTRADVFGSIGRPSAMPRALARPPEIGAAAVYLASDAAAFVTGQVLAVDGGTMLV